MLIETVQRNPANGHVLHVDFRQVDLNRPVRASVQIVFQGEAPAQAQGAVVVQALDTLEVEALRGACPRRSWWTSVVWWTPPRRSPSAS